LAGVQRAALGRDSYTYLHLPMVAGIILLSLGLKKVLQYVGDTEHHKLTDALHGMGLFTLYGGVILFLLGYCGFKLRATGAVSKLSLTGALVLIALIAVADRLPALAALGMLAVDCGALIAVDLVRTRRHPPRHSRLSA
jgi:low temperature requirement protein LtrA